ncbi:MAG: DUF1493 family protein [Hyphomonadaceae bacterium]
MSAADDAVLGEIIAAAKRATAAANIDANTRLYADLGMTGDDASNFMDEFAAKYAVDMSSFVWLRYFDDEGSDMMGPAIALAASILSPSFAVRWQAARDAQREITIAHLAEVARTTLWRHPGEALKTTRGPGVLTLVFSSISIAIAVFFGLGSVLVFYALVAGELGEQNLLVALGVIATGLVFPALGYASWRKIRRKLASASGASETAS